MHKFTTLKVRKDKQVKHDYVKSSQSDEVYITTPVKCLTLHISQFITYQLCDIMWRLNGRIGIRGGKVAIYLSGINELPH